MMVGMDDMITEALEQNERAAWPTARRANT